MRVTLASVYSVSMHTRCILDALVPQCWINRCTRQCYRCVQHLYVLPTIHHKSRSWHQCQAHACGMHDSHASHNTQLASIMDDVALRIRAEARGRTSRPRGALHQSPWPPCMFTHSMPLHKHVSDCRAMPPRIRTEARGRTSRPRGALNQSPWSPCMFTQSMPLHKHACDCRAMPPPQRHTPP